MEETGFGFDDVSVEMQDFEVVKTGKFDRSWKVGPGGSMVQIPLVHHGRIYFGSCNHNLYSLDAGTGKEMWRFRTSGVIFNSSPALSNGIVYIGSYDHNLYAVDPDSGKMLWKFQTSDKIVSSPFVSNGIVYIGSGDNFLYAVDARSGSLIWKFRTFDKITSTPTVYGDKVFVGSFDQNLYCLDAFTGKLNWKFGTNGEVHILNQLLVHNGVVYFGSFDNNLYAVDIDKGKKLWNFSMGKYGNFMSPVLERDILYQSSRDGTLYAIGLDGREMWRFRKNEMLAVPLIFNNRIYVGCDDFNLYCLDMNGVEKWKFQTQGIVWKRPVAYEGSIYFTSWDCNVYAMGLKDRSLRWKFRCDGSPAYIPPPHESFEVRIKLPGIAADEEKRRGYALDAISEGQAAGAYKSRITYQSSTRYAARGKYQKDSDEEAF